jgi:hypothetical protein
MKIWLFLMVLLAGEWCRAIEVAPPLKEDVPKEEWIKDDRYEEVPEVYLQAYWNTKPKEYLVDPQQLLRSSEADKHLAFLRYHADDSNIDVYLCLLGRNQRLPVNFAEDWRKRFFHDGDPAVVILYPMGDPARSLLLLSPDLEARLSKTEPRQALASAVAQAMAKSDGYGQLEAFLIQLSIRVYWMERALGLVDADSEHGSEESIAVKAAPKEEDKKSYEEYGELARLWMGKGLVVTAVLIALVAIRYRLRCRDRYRFPDFSVEARLGGRHGAGVGGVISFTSSSVPPAWQKEGER